MRDCLLCKGSGNLKAPAFPFSTSFSMMDFKTIWNSLGLTCEDSQNCGNEKPQDVLAAIRSFRPELAYIPPSLDEEGRITHTGLAMDVIMDYIRTIEEYATEALNRGEHLIWMP